MITGVKFVSIPVHDQERALLFYTENLGCRVAAELAAQGVEFKQGPKKESWGSRAIFRDSEGNRFVLSSR